RGGDRTPDEWFRNAHEMEKLRRLLFGWRRLDLPGLGWHDLRTGLQFVLAVHHNPLAGSQPLVDQGLPRFDLRHSDRPNFNDEIRTVRTAFALGLGVRRSSRAGILQTGSTVRFRTAGDLAFRAGCVIAAICAL